MGGLGPFATNYFFELLLKMTDASCDQEHLEIIIYNCPSIPDRTAHILGRSRENPATPMIEIGSKLVSLQVDYIAIPCSTAHFYLTLLSQNISVPIINMISETALWLKHNQIDTAGLLATEGTVFSKIFQEELRLHGIRLITPSKKGQESINQLIYDYIKAGVPINIEKFNQAAAELKDQGCQVIIIGCTELSLVKGKFSLGPEYLDALEVLAAQSLLLCGAKLKGEYNDLVRR